MSLVELRGGESDAEPEDEDTRPLTREEILSKLNNVPTFAILTAEDKMVSLGGKDVSPWEMCFSFFSPLAKMSLLLSPVSTRPSSFPNASVNM